MAKNTEQSKNTSAAVDKVTEKFLAAIKKDGIVHTFEWMHGWFDQVARAKLEDEVANYLGDEAKNPEAVNLYLVRLVMQLSSGISNHSTSASANLMCQARLAAASDMLGRNHENYGGSSHQSKAWDDLDQARKAAK